MRQRSLSLPTPAPRVAISILFVMMGLSAGTWFTRIPAVMSRHDLAVGQIGLLLLFFSLGALAVFQVSGRLIARWGSHRVARVAGLAFAAGLSLLALAPSPAVLAACLFATGATFGSLNVALNTQGVTIERHLGRRIMSSLHGWFTGGLLAGSVVAGGVARAGIGPVPHFAVVAATGVALLLVAGRALLPDQKPDAGRAVARGRHGVLPRALWPLGVLAVCASISEGSMYDWSALYVHRELGASEAAGATTFAAFALAMLAGRFLGDRMVERLGPVAVVRLGSALAASGLLAGLAGGTVPLAMIGFAVLGLGVAVLVPLFYSAAGSRDDVSSAQGVAAVATCGMLGLLAGPPLLGTLADGTSLRLALAFVALPCAVMVALAGAVAGPPPHPIPEAGGERRSPGEAAPVEAG